jgi:signal peptidase I
MSDLLQPTATSGESVPSPQPPARIHVRKSRGWLASVQSLAVTVVIALFVITFLIQAFQIPSQSMENTLLIGDYLLVDKVSYGHGGIWGEILPYSRIQRGHIIVFRYPVHPQQHFVKRVIAVPGDHVRVIDRHVVVNGVLMNESYVIHTRPDRDHFRDDFPYLDIPGADTEPRWWEDLPKLVHNGELVVPPGKYFVMGDNRDESQDSRYWGFVPRENIIGRPLLIYWSVRAPHPVDESPQGDKLSAFLYAVTHLLQDTRWDRTFRVVR